MDWIVIVWIVFQEFSACLFLSFLFYFGGRLGNMSFHLCTIISDVYGGTCLLFSLGRYECVHVSSCQEFGLIPLVNLNDVF